MQTQPVGSTTQLIKDRLSDDLLTPTELTEIRVALAKNPEREAVLDWVRGRYPGLVPLFMSTYAIDKWGDGLAVDSDGGIEPNVRKDIVASLGLDDSKPTKRGTSSWNFYMDSAPRIKSALQGIADRFDAELTIDSEHKPGLSLTTYLDFSWKGSPEFREALIAYGESIQHRDGRRWRF